jgi:hypothetical protein
MALTAIYFIFAAVHLGAAVYGGIKSDGDSDGIFASIFLGITGGLLVAAAVAR